MRRRAWIDRNESEFGLSTRAVRTSDARVRPLLYRDLYGFDLRRAGFSSWLEPPRPAVTLMIDLEGSITAGGGPLPSLYIAVSDPDAAHARATQAGAEVVRELTDTDYGSREFTVRDPEGNLWSFGTYNPHDR